MKQEKNKLFESKRNNERKKGRLKLRNKEREILISILKSYCKFWT